MIQIYWYDVLFWLSLVVLILFMIFILLVIIAINKSLDK